MFRFRIRYQLMYFKSCLILNLKSKVSLSIYYIAPRMPSRKRNKGQTRKAQQQQQQQQLQDALQQLIPVGCTHGCKRSLRAYMLNAFIAWHKEAQKLRTVPKHTVPAICIVTSFRAIEITHDMFPRIWNDGSDREIARRFFVSYRTKCLLEGDSDFAKAAAIAAIVAESYQPSETNNFDPQAIIEADKHFMNIKDAVRGCHRSLVRFFKKRIPCACLDGQYQSAVASRPKTGVCDNCMQRHDRKDLMDCSRCSTSQYCSRKCQGAHWAFHKPFCMPAGT